MRREHRGHRLGTLVKVANLERLLDVAPEARRVHTWNADTNTYMVAINELDGLPIARQRESPGGSTSRTRGRRPTVPRAS